MPIDYSKSIIYKLVCKDPTITDLYVGSTLNITTRKNSHKTKCNNPNSKRYDLKVYKFIREKGGGWNNWQMIEVEKYCATDKQDLLKRERFFLELLKATLNSNIPSHSLIEWRDENKDNIKIYKQIYHKENKEKILIKQQIRITCECGRTIQINEKSRHQKSKIHQAYLTSLK